MQDSARSRNAVEDLERQLRVRERILSSMLDLGRAVSAELQMEPLCDLVVSRLAETFEVDAATLFFRDEDTGVLCEKRRYVARGTAGDESSRQRAAQAALLSERVVCDTEQCAALADLERTDQYSLVAVPLKAEGAKDSDDATAAVPLKAENKIKGVITMTWPVEANRPTDDDLRLLDVLAGQIAPAIDNAWLYSRLEDLNAGLEAKVEARTKALAVSNEQLRRTIEELKQAQAQLVQSEKMASLGQLTAGVAHEINNPLAFAISNTAIARERLARMRLLCQLFAVHADAVSSESASQRKRLAKQFIERLRESPSYREDVLAFEADLAGLTDAEQADLAMDFLRYVRAREQQSAGIEELADGIDALLDRSREGLERVKGIVLDLRSFSRLDEAQYQNADIDEGIAGTLGIVTHVAKDRQVSLEQERGLTQSYPCYSAKLNQVVLNLVTNALQATPPRGAVTVRTWEDDTGVYIEVEDTGSGIPVEHLTRIFDPFFTTKPVGQGTGLGLSISYKIIEEHKGTIRVDSRPGEGSRFTICLPPRSV